MGLRRWLPDTLPLRYKLLALALVPVLLVIPGILALTIHWGSGLNIQYLLLKSNTDLSVARDAFQRTQREYLERLGRLADSRTFRLHLDRGDLVAAQAQVQALVRRSGFDFARLIDARGRPLAGDGPARPSSLQARAAGGVPAMGVEIYSHSELAREDPRLAARVRLPLVRTPRAEPTERTLEDRGMVLHAVYPVMDADGRVSALLEGGVLLNGNLAFVDAIRDLVYGPGSLPEGGIGTVTVFLDDVRIATNVELEPGVRAVGTRVSAEVREQVLERGEPWSKRAFVVNDWYIAAYEPIMDVRGERVGMLYAGFLEAPFKNDYQETLAVLLLMFALALVFAAWLAVAGAGSIFKPIETLTAVVRATQAGQHVRIGPVGARDEVGELARQFDAMLDLLEERNRQIRQAADGLEQTVEARTEELRRKNRELEGTIRTLHETRQQLVTAEKFAALGKLSAGIAHEINNPTAILLGNLELLVQELGEAARPAQGEIELMYEQIERINTLVKNLLNYARPAEYAAQLDTADLGNVLERAGTLSRHLAVKAGIRVSIEHRARTPVRINASELQQVLMNLVINAIQAQPGGGMVEVTSDDWEERGVVIGVRDEGHGIPSEQLAKVFDPFFTTKDQESGTGLGLAISYGLVRRTGGHITVESEVGRGTLFQVWLPREPRKEDPGEGWLNLFG